MPAALPIPDVQECLPFNCVTRNDPPAPCICPEEIVTVDVLATMAATTPYGSLKQFIVAGWTTAGDGYGGIWGYYPDSVQVADGYYVVSPPGASGRYIKIT